MTEIEKSDTDYRKYKILTLENGLKAVLISDLKPGEVENDESSDSENEDEDSNGESDNEVGSETGDTPCKKGVGKQRSAAALCVGVGGFHDPIELQGLAHYMEHMVFMGSKKYPCENDFDAYISQRGGETNAWTDAERTCFYFNVRKKHFFDALDKFANFFIEPLLNPDSLDRELTAVHSEYEMQLSNDHFVSDMIMNTFSKESSPFRIFMTGNKKSLKEIPESRGINVHEHLHDMRKRMYSAHFMTLAVQAKEELEDLETMVRKIFDPVPFNGMQKPALSQSQSPFDTEQFRNFYIVAPIKDIILLKLTWSLPSVLHNYKCQPVGVLSFVIGHEGKGSLITHLRKMNLALELSAGAARLPDGENNSLCCLFTVSITLTERGYQDVHAVIDHVFSYMAMFRDRGVDKSLFEEYQQLCANKFKFMELSEPVVHVEYMAQALHAYEDRHVVSANILVYEYNPKLYQELLLEMTADKCNFLLMARCHEKECTITEPWYNGRYALREIPAEVKQRWINAKSSPNFHLPLPNKYIAKNFDLIPIDKEMVPINLCEEMGPEAAKFGSLFYKLDHIFRVPKAEVYLFLRSNLGHESVENAVLIDLLVYALNQDLKELTYDAEEASLEFDINGHMGGIEIKMSGYNDKLFLLFEVIVSGLRNINFDAERFTSFKEKQRQIYLNKAFKPGSLSHVFVMYFLYNTHHLCTDKLATLENITVDKLLHFHRQYLQNLKIELYVHGNVTKDEAKHYFKFAKETLNFEPLKEVIRTQTKTLPVGSNGLRVMNVNPMDVNTVTTSIYQLGPADLKLQALNNLLELVLQEPCFDYLRTKETLGYGVGLHVMCRSGILHLSTFVMCQADKFSLNHCQEKMDYFIFDMAPTIINDITAKAFDTYIQTLISINEMEDVHMGNEASRNWNEVLLDAYLFDRRKKMIEIFKTLTKEDLIHFYQQNYVDSNVMKKMTVQIDASPDAKSNVQINPCKSFNIDLEVKIPESNVTHPINWMSDYKSFKSSLNTFPYHNITK